jgi:hypothetical protein
LFILYGVAAVLVGFAVFATWMLVRGLYEESLAQPITQLNRSILIGAVVALGTCVAFLLLVLWPLSLESVREFATWPLILALVTVLVGIGTPVAIAIKVRIDRVKGTREDRR